MYGNHIYHSIDSISRFTRTCTVVCSSSHFLFKSIMRPLTEDETKELFEKLSKYIGENIKLLIDRPDGNYCFRLAKDRIFYVREGEFAEGCGKRQFPINTSWDIVAILSRRRWDIVKTSLRYDRDIVKTLSKQCQNIIETLPKQSKHCRYVETLWKHC